MSPWVRTGGLKQVQVRGAFTSGGRQSVIIISTFICFLNSRCCKKRQKWSGPDSTCSQPVWAAAEWRIKWFKRWSKSSRQQIRDQLWTPSKHTCVCCEIHERRRGGSKHLKKYIQRAFSILIFDLSNIVADLLLIYCLSRNKGQICYVCFYLNLINIKFRTPVMRWTTYGSCRGTKSIYISSSPLLK